jgi:hypothetical protein
VTDQGTPPITTPPVRRPPKRTPSRKPSHWVRNATIGIIGVFVLLAAIGSATSRQGLVTGPTAPPDVVASDEAVSSAEASEDVSPTPGGTSLLSIKGTGPTTSDPFQASGTSVDVAYTFTCPAEDSFTLNFYGTNASPLLPDVLASEFSTTGSDTANEPLNGNTGPFTFEIDSPCAWTVEVTGTP